MSVGGAVPDLGPSTSIFWANVQQHLTVLSLFVRRKGGEVRYLDSLNMLVALKSLTLKQDFPVFLHPVAINLSITPPPCHRMLGETLTLNLPNLVELDWHYVQPLQKELILPCPKLAHAVFVGLESVRIKVEHATLEYLTLAGHNIMLVLECPEVQLKNLRSLNVDEGSETGQHLAQDLDQRTNLKYLRCVNFPAACMPRSFSESLQDIELHSLD